MSAVSKLTTEHSPEEKRALLAQLLQKKASQSKSLFPLSPAQQGLWFLYTLAPQSWAYNTLFAARICSHVDVPALQRAFGALLDRHPSLRTTYTLRDGRPVQQVHEHAQVHFEETDASACSQTALKNRLVEEARRPFNLERGPLLRVNLFTQSATEHILLLTTPPHCSRFLVPYRVVGRAPRAVPCPKSWHTGTSTSSRLAIRGLRSLADRNASKRRRRTALDLLAETACW